MDPNFTICKECFNGLNKVLSIQHFLKELRPTSNANDNRNYYVIDYKETEYFIAIRDSHNSIYLIEENSGLFSKAGYA